MEDEDLLAVIRALDDGQQVVLALGQQGGRHPDVVHGVVDAVEADTDPRRREEDQGEEAGTGGDEDALEPTAAPWTRFGLVYVPCRPRARVVIPKSRCSTPGPRADLRSNHPIESNETLGSSLATHRPFVGVVARMRGSPERLLTGR